MMVNCNLLAASINYQSLGDSWYVGMICLVSKYLFGEKMLFENGKFLHCSITGPTRCGPDLYRGQRPHPKCITGSDARMMMSSSLNHMIS